MHYTYTPTGVHSKSIEFDIEENIVKNVKIIGGCDGNNQGMAALAEGRTTEDVIRLLSGIPCGKKPTSCPDQLAKAVAQAIGK
ncbi:MAG: TIGR03905 family TSCPD domain-containing protein [Oscillospiraceae bacterium]|nr:TIGR03905 family TSCPD domain-containing protein [Oscillospiraceae bacterium]